MIPVRRGVDQVGAHLASGPLGTIESLVLAEGDGPPPGPPGIESAVVLLTGSARWQGNPVRPGDGVFSPAGGEHGLTAAGAGACVLILHGGPGSPGPTVSWRYAPAGDDSDAILDNAGGFKDMGVRWLATVNTVGSTSLVVATSTFAPGGNHALHWHVNADEYFLVVAGGGEHLDPDGPIRMRPGDLVVVPAGRPHGFRTDPGTTTRAIYGYLGAGSLDAAGYELEREDAADDRGQGDRDWSQLGDRQGDGHSAGTAWF